MKMLLWIFATVIGLTIVGLIAVAVFVPASRSATHSITLNGSIEEVWQVYNDVESQPNWRDDVKSIRITSGGDAMLSWVEVNKQGLELSFRVVASEPPYRLELETGSENFFHGSYIAEFEAIGDGKTRGTFTEAMTTEGFFPKLMNFLFVNPRKLIEKYAEDAQAEIKRRGE